MKKIAVLGSTGSIGTQTLEVVRNNGDIKVTALAAGSNIEALEAQIREFRPEKVCVFQEEKAKELKDSLAQIEEQLTTAKTEISEKVHTENVKCYRNISDLFRSMDERLDKLTVMESRMHPVRIFSLTGMILGIVNLVVLLLVLLVSVGVIAF